MRDFHDAKVMAHTLRDTLGSKGVVISHSESLEYIAKVFGVSDWNTMSAMLRTGATEGKLAVSAEGAGPPRYSAIPIRDHVPFPRSTFPLYVGREKTLRSLERSFKRHREVVLTIQKDSAVEDPAPGDIYDVGVLATLLDMEELPAAAKFAGQDVAAGGTKIMVHAHGRVKISRFIKEGEAYEVEINELDEAPAADDPDLVRKVTEGFMEYAAANEIKVPPTWPALVVGRDMGRVADFLAQHMRVPISEKQELLATRDAAERMKKIAAIIER